MYSSWKRSGVVGALAVSLLAWGCEVPTTAPAPESTQLAPEDGLRSIHSTVGGAVDQIARAVIGIQGGVLELDNHKLTVPAGAVLAPTRFTMRLVPNGGVVVDLRAIQPGAGNIGASGFEIPVQLSLSYADTDAEDPEDLVIVRILPGGERIPLESTVDTDAQLVTADLDHFSRYGLCSN